MDDDEFQRLYFQEELEEEGYRVRSVGDGREALKEIAEERPAVVVMDVTMPGMDGIQTLSSIKSRYPALPVVLHSCHPGYKNNYLCWIADDFVIKSADTAPLKQALQKLLLEPLGV
ncbi:MAG: response regulator [Candidatus Brocadiales bacterium]